MSLSVVYKPVIALCCVVVVLSGVFRYIHQPYPPTLLAWAMVIGFVLAIIAAREVFRSDKILRNDKWLWIAALVSLVPLAAFVYFFFVREKVTES